jgi:hypothetical protein
MTRIQTRPATLTASQAATMFHAAGMREVLVDGKVVGHYGRNKHGITIGHCDPEAVHADGNPFVAARPEYGVLPAGRHLGRKTKDVVADIAAGRTRR